MPKTKRKILFLDFDGVLNHGAGPFHPECVRELNRITDMTGAEIVVHSSWRYSRTLGELRKILKVAGVTGDVIGTAPTPDTERRESGVIVLDEEGFRRFTQGMPTKADYERPAAIQRWLDDHLDVTPDDVVILDDTSFMAHLHGRHIRTRGDQGLTREQAGWAIRMLQRVTW